MKLHPVISDMLNAIGYDRKLRILEVIYNTNGTYRYFAVPPSKYRELMTADSIGNYMHKYIIGHYEYERVA